MHTFRCMRCGHRFRGRTLRLRYLWYAKCPMCTGLQLINWQEKYYYPPAYKRMLTYLGWREQRCEDCRYNFVSLRPRWKVEEVEAK